MKLNHIGLLFTAVLLATSFTSSARDRDSGFYLTGLLGYNLFDQERNLDNDPSFAGGVGYDFSKVWGTEIIYGQADLEDEDSGKDVDNKFGRIDALYHFLPEEKLRPFLIAGVGHNELDASGGKDLDETLLNIGVGLKHAITDSIDLRADARGYYSTDHESKDGAVNVGLSYLFGSKGKAPVDSDGDGIFDNEDQCPATAAGVEVDAMGCEVKKDSDGDGVLDSDDQCPNSEPGTTVDAEGCPLDSDNDGVTDNLDQCSDSPAGAKVDAEGCPLDSDNDGVYDGLDTCPETPEGAKVDSEGCRITLTEDITARLQVNFPINSAEVSDDFMAEIERVVDVMRQYPDTNVVIEGHTDSPGEEAYNQNLSELRAKAVRDIIVNRYNIDAARISSVGFGESKPVAENNTAAGRELNRRVVAVITAQVEQ